MKRKLIGIAALVGALALALAPSAIASDKLQMMLGGPGDPNVYCNGECATGGCCIVGG